MKYFLIPLLLLICRISAAQNDFTGIVKYKIYSDNSPNTDSMTAIFDKQRVKVILYISESVNSKTVSEMVFIDDLRDRKSITVNVEKKTYKIDSLNANPKYKFINTRKIEASTTNALCLLYKADSSNLDRSKIARVNCLGSINYLNSLIKEYFFLGVQPIVVDERIVMEFIVTNADGTKARTSVTEITSIENVASYFDLKDYTQEE